MQSDLTEDRRVLPDGEAGSIRFRWDMDAPDVFVTVAAARCPFRVAGPALTRLADSPPTGVASNRGLRQILPPLFRLITPTRPRSRTWATCTR